MKPENAHFKPLDFWKNNECKTTDDVLDFSRCLEDTAFPVLTNFCGWDKSENEPLPTAEEMKKHPKNFIPVYRKYSLSGTWFRRFHIRSDSHENTQNCRSNRK